MFCVQIKTEEHSFNLIKYLFFYYIISFDDFVNLNISFLLLLLLLFIVHLKMAMRHLIIFAYYFLLQLNFNTELPADYYVWKSNAIQRIFNFFSSHF